MNDDRPELLAEIDVEAKRALAIARRLVMPCGRIVRPKEPTLANRGRRLVKSVVDEDPRRCYQGTVHVSDKAWPIRFKQLRLRPQVRCEKVAHNPRSIFQYPSSLP
jgi:hypothetical protein